MPHYGSPLGICDGRMVQPVGGHSTPYIELQGFVKTREEPKRLPEYLDASVTPREVRGDCSGARPLAIR